MSRGSRRGHARHTHARRVLTGPYRRPHRPTVPVTLTGGPLNGCDTVVHRGQQTLRVPCASGRYVQIDGDQWAWETDHTPMKGTRMTAAAHEAEDDARAEANERLVSGTYPPGHWAPGDPCNACGSVRTVYDPDAGGVCLACRRSDADK